MYKKWTNQLNVYEHIGAVNLGRFRQRSILHQKNKILVRLKTLKFYIKAVSDTVFDLINAVYHDKPLMFIRDIRLSLSRLFLTLY